VIQVSVCMREVVLWLWRHLAISRLKRDIIRNLLVKVAHCGVESGWLLVIVCDEMTKKILRDMADLLSKARQSDTDKQHFDNHRTRKGQVSRTILLQSLCPKADDQARDMIAAKRLDKMQLG
jgi:hypothetical protein